MIEGLKFDVTSGELASHLAGRIDHHRERQEFYREKASALASGGAEGQEYTGGDPVRSLRESANKHANRADLFEFLQDHIIPSEKYRLEESDLTQLEILSRYF